MHSERTLLQELPHLWKAFVDRYSCIPRLVILYSWMMPCPECTEKICQTAQDTKPGKNTSVIIAYTIDWIAIPYDDNEKSRHQLQAAGIIVEKVAYDSVLPPAQDSESDEQEEDEMGEELLYYWQWLNFRR